MNILLRRRKLGNGSCKGIKAASTADFTILRNDNMAAFPDDLTYALCYVFRWGCTSSLPEREGVVVINSAKSIHWCSDKRQGRLDMQSAGVSVPETWGDAESWRASLGTYDTWPTYPEPDNKYVLRPQHHAQGRNLQVFERRDEEDGTVSAAMQQLGVCYISRLINKVAEYRVMVVQNRVAWVARKTPADASAIAWNVALGGRFDNVRWDSWPLAVVAESLKAAKVSGCDFCGVDVMVDADGKAYVLEVNSAPSQTSAYRQACVAKCFDHIVINGKEPFLVPDRIQSWKNVIHPAIWSRSNA